MSHNIPTIFKPILWSYDFEKCDPLEMKNILISNTINYGRLDHWRWIKSFYGNTAIKETINSPVALSSMRSSAVKLANIMFSK